MSIPQLVSSVELVFAELEKEITSFQARSSLHCMSGCGECCKKPDIEATVLEFVPLASYLYKNGLINAFMDVLEQENAGNLCIIFAPVYKNASTGSCGEYKYRGLICRLFGFAASLDKYGKPILATCRIIKEGQADTYKAISEKIKNGEEVPVMRNYYMKMYSIDPVLSEKFYPINVAIRLAIEKVMNYYKYREVELEGEEIFD